MGLGGQERQGQVATFQAELPDTLDGILDKVREIILKGEVKSILIRDGQPISYQRFVDSSEPSSEGEPLAAVYDLGLPDIVRNVEMEEFDVRGQGLAGLSAQIVFFWAYVFLEHEGWFPSYLLISESSKFWSWLTIPRRMATKIDRFMGMKLERDKSVPSDVFLMCAARHKNAAATEIKFVLKVSMEESNAHSDQKAIGDGDHSNTDSTSA